VVGDGLLDPVDVLDLLGGHDARQLTDLARDGFAGGGEEELARAMLGGERDQQELPRRGDVVEELARGCLGGVAFEPWMGDDRRRLRCAAARDEPFEMLALLLGEAARTGPRARPRRGARTGCAARRRRSAASRSIASAWA
jgi:hypothetical protein